MSVPAHFHEKHLALLSKTTFQREMTRMHPAEEEVGGRLMGAMPSSDAPKILLNQHKGGHDQPIGFLQPVSSQRPDGPHPQGMSPASRA